MGQELGGGQILLGALSPLGQNGRARQRHAVTSAPACRHLVLVLGDQLSGNSTAFDDFDAEQDVVLMVEAREESTHVWSHRARTALFLAAMRHFAQRLETEGKRVVYRRLDESRDATLADGWYAAVTAFCPQRIVCVEPGDWRVWRSLNAFTTRVELPLDLRPDRHFLCSRDAFARWAGGSATLRMEVFYRHMRRQHAVLMDGDQPAGGRWNFDEENRRGFGKAGPGFVPEPPRFEPDSITREVLQLVEHEFPGHPGKTEHFNWPVTREQALIALTCFVRDRLPAFGPFQDAMWTGMPFGWHSLLSAALNLKLLDPREVIAAAEQAWRSGKLDLASVEGFIRQVLGWREFVRGVYYLDMPQLKTANHFEHHNALPDWYWTGNTQMNCMKQCIHQTLEFGYAHHIQRLMVTGMWGVLAEIAPQELADWYLAVYVDAVEWVELPNTVGMALFANGGRFTSKPYIASGAYIKRMSNYCDGCRYRPDQRSGDGACPFTVLYWRFLDHHEKQLAANPRTALMARNLSRLSADERSDIRETAGQMLRGLDRL